MNPQKNQGEANPSLLRDLQAEVSAESAPLLQFILRNAGVIAAVVVVFLLVLVGMGGWQWYSSSRSSRDHEELARILLQKQGAEQVRALERLAEDASDGARFAVNLALGKSAVESGEHAVAAAAYARAARMDRGALGQAAALEEAGALLAAGKAADALEMLQTLRSALPPEVRAPHLTQTLAEAALAAGRPEQAAELYLELANESQGLHAGYFRARAGRISSGGAAGAAQSPDAAPASGAGAAGK